MFSLEEMRPCVFCVAASATAIHTRVQTHTHTHGAFKVDPCHTFNPLFDWARVFRYFPKKEKMIITITFVVNGRR
jgi:hypothetical protein